MRRESEEAGESLVRAVAQRVSQASVRVSGVSVGEIGPGFLLLVGVEHGDGAADADALADKVVGLRVFADESGHMNRSLRDTQGAVLVVSQFTLLAALSRGRRPSFTAAAPPEIAEPLLDRLVARVAAAGVEVATGRFGAKMDVELVNDGPVTIVIDVADGRVL